MCLSLIPGGSVCCSALRRQCHLKACLVIFTLMVMFLSFPLRAADSGPLIMDSPAEGIYVHVGRQEAMSVGNSAEIANIGFIIGEKSVMVVDPGSNPAQGQRLLEAIRARTDLPISHIVLTHFHPDHVFGAKSFLGMGQFVAHRRYPLAMVQRANFYKERFTYLNVDGADGLVNPDMLIADSVLVDLGNRSVKLIAYPTAHTDHDLAVVDIRTGTLWASDLLFVDRIPSLDGSVTGWLALTKALMTDKTIRLVIPGHGSPGTADNLFKAQLTYLTKLVDETRIAVRQNVGLAAATSSIAKDEKSKWLLFDLQHAGNVTKAYTELEWE